MLPQVIGQSEKSHRAPDAEQVAYRIDRSRFGSDSDRLGHILSTRLSNRFIPSCT